LFIVSTFCGKHSRFHIELPADSLTATTRPTSIPSALAVSLAFAFAAASAMSRTFFLSSGMSLRRKLPISVAPDSAPCSISGPSFAKSRVVARTVIWAR